MASFTAAIRLPTLACLALLCAVALQGCTLDVPRHKIGNWEAKPNYLTEFQHVLAGTPSKAILNSCNDPAVMGTSLQCAGHGKCRAWNDVAPGASQAKPLMFCECDRDYADPECRTPRKSQVTAFVLTVCLGVFAVDQIYLGFPLWFVIKFLVVFCLGGYSAWSISWTDKALPFYTKALLLGAAIFYYLYDVCRTGSSAVLTKHNFRVSADLSHFTFVLTAVCLMLFIGFAAAIKSIHDNRKRKAHELLLLRMMQKEDEDLGLSRQKAIDNTPPFSGYGSTMAALPQTVDLRQIPASMPTVPTAAAPRIVTSGAPVPPVTLAPSSTPPVVTMAPSQVATPSNLLASVPAVTMLPPTSGNILLPQVQGRIPSSIAATSNLVSLRPATNSEGEGVYLGTV